MRRRRGRAFTAWLAVTALVAAALVGGGVWVAAYFRDALAPGLSVGCRVVVDGRTSSLADDQAENAALIAAISVRRGMPARAASIALATALQESKLRNIDYGDLDSLGLFQQRPSQEWGTPAEIMDPVYATNAFYNVLAEVSGYAQMSINDAAQLVQRSAYPYAYARHESVAKAFASALTGQSPEALSCTLEAPARTGDPGQVTAAAETAFGELAVSAAPAGAEAAVVRIKVTEATGWAVAQWAVANAKQFAVTSVHYAGRQWTRSANDAGTNVGWQGSPTPGPAGEVSIALAGAPSAR
ncbi:hypothetical protein [Specibacter sp. RAF43]|uniref:hypothetical protein n=1 Tax=Specibacter sp. RAF43 TaxID=3233057 RepID=UPI003F950B33